jgi:hypothetical protein
MASRAELRPKLGLRPTAPSTGLGVVQNWPPTEVASTRLGCCRFNRLVGIGGSLCHMIQDNLNAQYEASTLMKVMQPPCILASKQGYCESSRATDTVRVDISNFLAGILIEYGTGVHAAAIKFLEY